VVFLSIKIKLITHTKPKEKISEEVKMGIDGMESGRNRDALESEQGAACAGTSSAKSARLTCVACSAAALLAAAVLVALSGHEERIESELQQEGTWKLAHECSLFGCHTVRKLMVSRRQLEEEHAGHLQAMKSTLSNKIVSHTTIPSEAENPIKNHVASQDDGMGAWPVRERLLKQIKEELPDDVSSSCDFTVEPCVNLYDVFQPRSDMPLYIL